MPRGKIEKKLNLWLNLFNTMIQKVRVKLYGLLRWSEQYTKTDMVYLAKGGFWLTLGQGISSLSSFLLVLAFANFLPKEVYGNYKYILSIAGVLSIFTLGGINTAITQATARGFDETFNLGLKTKIKWGLIGGLTSLILALYYYLNNNFLLAINFSIAAIFLPIMDSFGLYDALLQGKKLFKLSTKYFIISQIVALTSIIGVLFFTKNIYLIVLAYFASWTLMRFIFTKITLSKLNLNDQKDTSALSFGKHLSLINVFSTAVNQLDQILLFHFLGATPLAVYALAVAVPTQIKGLLKNLAALALPKLSEKTGKEIKAIIFSKMVTLGLAITVIVVVYIIFAPFVYKLFFPQYLDSIFYSQIFAISLIGTASVLSTTALQAKGSKKQLYQLNICGSIIQLSLLFVSIYFYGLIGAIIARVLNRFIYLFMSILLIKKIED